MFGLFGEDDGKREVRRKMGWDNERELNKYIKTRLNLSLSLSSSSAFCWLLGVSRLFAELEAFRPICLSVSMN